VLQADGGTRTAAITGSYVALALAVRKLQVAGLLVENPMRHWRGSGERGIVDGQPLLDLCYTEDAAALRGSQPCHEQHRRISSSSKDGRRSHF